MLCTQTTLIQHSANANVFQSFLKNNSQIHTRVLRLQDRMVHAPPTSSPICFTYQTLSSPQINKYKACHLTQEGLASLLYITRMSRLVPVQFTGKQACGRFYSNLHTYGHVSNVLHTIEMPLSYAPHYIQFILQVFICKIFVKSTLSWFMQIFARDVQKRILKLC